MKKVCRCVVWAGMIGVMRSGTRVWLLVAWMALVFPLAAQDGGAAVAGDGSGAGVSTLETLIEAIGLADSALSRIDGILAKELEEGLRQELEAVRRVWSSRLAEAASEVELIAEVGREGIRSLRVEFKEAGASSLDYEVLADFSGGMASRWNVLGRLIPRICVDVCNEQGWVIPFTQITLHQAE